MAAAAPLSLLLEAEEGDFLGRERKKQAELVKAARSALADLGPGKIHVQGFDAEQIWYQLDLQTTKHLASLDKKLGALLDRIEDQESESESDVESGEAASSDDSEFEEFLAHELQEEQARSDTSLEDDEDSSGSDSSDEDDEDDDGSSSEDAGVAAGESHSESEEDSEGEVEGELLPTEDQFFRLGQMEDFVQQAEELYEKEMMDEGESGEDDEEEEEDDEEDEEDERDKRMMYDDFFKKEKKGRRGEAKKSVRFAMDEDEGDDSDDKADEGRAGGPRWEDPAKVASEEDDEDEVAEKKSRQEIRSERLERRIKRLEDANMAEAHWTMKGEVKASQRPENSLLEVDLDFQHSANPPIEPTQEMADEIEDIIKARISEGLFDDVIPIVVAEAPEEAQAGEELDDKKSARGLAEIYESEYMQIRGFSDIEDKQKKKQEACWILYRSIAAHLDAMSHFEFTPRPITESVGDQNAANTPAIAMEEVGMEALSTAGTLAPGEIKAPSKGLVKADGELEKEERRSRRRTNKKRKKAKNAGEARENAPRKKLGRKSFEEEVPQGKKVRYSKSGDVFKLLQEQQEQAAAQKDKASEGRSSKSAKGGAGARENKNALKL
ncbi:U3 small nucleolar ribonucleoprotein MPP10 [Chloropicon primus]|nr:U3 small nucleolar ribonucleoprotein MPP10 [Chloropicon primus]